jgi:hypothetical protein
MHNSPYQWVYEEVFVVAKDDATQPREKDEYLDSILNIDE